MPQYIQKWIVSTTCFLSFLCCVHLYASDNYNYRTVLIFLDDTENEDMENADFDYNADQLFIALHQKPCPIITSSSLLKIIFAKYDYNKLKIKEWISKKITDDLYCLIPKTYLTRCGVSIASAKNSNAQEVTDE
jgi:hypothetical protein